MSKRWASDHYLALVAYEQGQRGSPRTAAVLRVRRMIALRCARRDERRVGVRVCFAGAHFHFCSVHGSSSVARVDVVMWHSLMNPCALSHIDHWGHLIRHVKVDHDSRTETERPLPFEHTPSSFGQHLRP